MYFETKKSDCLSCNTKRKVRNSMHQVISFELFTILFVIKSLPKISFGNMERHLFSFNTIIQGVMMVCTSMWRLNEMENRQLELKSDILVHFN